MLGFSDGISVALGVLAERKAALDKKHAVMTMKFIDGIVGEISMREIKVLAEHAVQDQKPKTIAKKAKQPVKKSKVIAGIPKAVVFGKKKEPSKATATLADKIVAAIGRRKNGMEFRQIKELAGSVTAAQNAIEFLFGIKKIKCATVGKSKRYVKK